MYEQSTPKLERERKPSNFELQHDPTREAPLVCLSVQDVTLDHVLQDPSFLSKDKDVKQNFRTKLQQPTMKFQIFQRTVGACFIPQVGILKIVYDSNLFVAVDNTHDDSIGALLFPLCSHSWLFLVSSLAKMPFLCESTRELQESHRGRKGTTP